MNKEQNTKNKEDKRTRNKVHWRKHRRRLCAGSLQWGDRNKFRGKNCL